MVPDLIGFETDKRLASSRGRSRQWLSGHSTKASKHSRKRRGARLILLSCLMACMAATGSPSQAEPPKLQIDAELRSLHVLPDSQFAEIGGETIHFVDEGVGASILLVHGSFASLRQWDYWAERLSEEFRVVRFDLSPLGLSGPHPENAYSVEDRIALIDGLMDRLGIGKFTIVGTSSSGVPVTAYAAARPDRLNGVVLSNIAIGKLTIDYSSLPPALLAAVKEDLTHPGYHKPDYWRQILLHNVENDSVVTEAIVDRWTALNNRAKLAPDAVEALIAASSALRTPDDLAKISVPTLLLWSQNDHETTLKDSGLQALDMLTVADRTLIAIGGCGHMMPLDCPDQSLDAALPFLRRVKAEPLEVKH